MVSLSQLERNSMIQFRPQFSNARLENMGGCRGVSSQDCQTVCFSTLVEFHRSKWFTALCNESKFITK